MKRIILATALCAAAAQASAQSEDVVLPPEEELGQGDPAWHAAVDMLDGLITPEAQSRLFLLAWTVAAGNLCDPLVLNADAFAEAYAAIEHAEPEGMTEAEAAYFQAHLNMNFGVAVGIIMAQSAATPAGLASFCAEAVALDAALPAQYFEPPLAEVAE